MKRVLNEVVEGEEEAMETRGEVQSHNTSEHRPKCEEEDRRQSPDLVLALSEQSR
jgi:hypothetical protein